MPEKDDHNVIGIKPQNIKPIWAEVPMLLQFWLAGLISGVNMLDVDATEISNCKFSDNALIYSLPGVGKRETVPLNYCGYSVYSAQIGGWIKFPELKASPEQKTENEDANFWNSL